MNKAAKFLTKTALGFFVLAIAAPMSVSLWALFGSLASMAGIVVAQCLEESSLD